VALVGTDISEELIASIITVDRIKELGTTLAVTSNCSTMQRTTDFMRKEVTEWELPAGLVAT
jgi:hypothetical protein